MKIYPVKRQITISFRTHKKIIQRVVIRISQLYQTKQFPVTSSLKLIMTIGLILSGITACQKKPENIIIISIDTLNQSAVKAYNPKAPYLETLDSLTNQSVVFKRAYSSASWTLPAHGSLFTGRYPDRHGAVHPRLKLSKNIPTLTASLKKSGFYTAAFTDGLYVSRAFGFARGFDQYDDWSSPSASIKGPVIPRNGKRNKVAGQTLFDRGIAFINGREKRDSGFFLFLHTYVVHDYFRLHPWTVNRLPSYPDKDEEHYLSCIMGKKTCPPADWERLKSLYQAELYRMDEGLARLLAALDRKGLRDSTLIIFMSDHGEGFDSDRNRIHHGGRLHEDQINIPLMISGSGIRPGINNAQVSIVDIMPTVLDLCGISIPSGLDGVSFADVLCGKQDDHSKVFYAMEYSYWWDSGRRFTLSSVRDISQGEPLSIVTIHGDDWYIRDRNGEEIYNMNNDPLQSNNLSSKSPLKSELRRLADKRSVYRPSAPAARPDKETIDHLRSLGYIE